MLNVLDNMEKSESFVLEDIVGFDVRPYISLVRFETEETIMKEGERPEYLYYMTEGRAKLFLTQDNGRIALINFLTAPCFIGEMELLDPCKRADGVKAITPCECYRIAVNLCGGRLLEDTKFLRYLCRFLSGKAEGNTANYSKNVSYPLRNRLAAFILETSVGGMYRERHTEVAEYLGVTYRHLLYVFAEFVKEGLLEKVQAGYRIKDIGKMRNLAC